MPFADDDEFRQIARSIEDKAPGWFVVWGLYTRQFVAFPLFDAPRERSSRRITRMRLLTVCAMRSAGWADHRRKEALVLMTLDRVPENPVSECAGGTAMRMVAERLTANGVAIRMPDYADSRRLNIVNARRARSEIIAEDCGYVVWDYWPWSGAHSDPADITSLVLRVLGADHYATTRNISAQPALKLKGIVGRDLAARGLRVSLEVFEDLVAFDVVAEISVTNPARPERGRVCITDEGSVMWEYHHESTRETLMDVVDTITPVLTNGIGGCRTHAARGCGENDSR